MLDYITANEAAKKWGISHRRVIKLCGENRIENAAMLGKMWIIPSDAEKPADARLKEKGTNITEARMFKVTVEETVDGNFFINANSIKDATEKAISMYKQQQITLEPGELTAKSICVYDIKNDICTGFEAF